MRMSDNTRTTAERYLRKPYTYVLERHDDTEKPYFSMRIAELEGCVTTGETIEEAARDIQDAMREWLEFNIRLGKVIPEPFRSRQYGGKLVVRMPPTLHEALLTGAAREGVSLNQYVVAALARAQGFQEGVQAARKPAKRITPRPRSRIPAA